MEMSLATCLGKLSDSVLCWSSCLAKVFTRNLALRLSSRSLPGRSKKNIKQAGLTLIEVLIALAIVSIALTAVIKAATQNIHSTAYLQKKTTAMFVGQQVVNEIRAHILKPSSSGSQKLTTKMLGDEWFWQTQEQDTPNNKIKKVLVTVYENENEEAESAPVVTLESYVYVEK
jgi:general secretion pathway protein I